MSFKKIIREISQHESIIEHPPVLLDVGASGKMNPCWKAISDFSVCILFDADNRDFKYKTEESGEFGKTIKVNKILTEKSTGKKELFYLTKSPHCSSKLEPNESVLKDFHYSPLFDVVEKATIDTIDLPTILNDLSLNYIDWFKTDSQGTDLRLFKSIDESIQNQIVTLEFEPGFIEFYKGEDRVFDCLNYLEKKKEFFLVEFIVKGPLRIPSNIFDPMFSSQFSKKIATHTYNNVPGWAEMTFMNDLKKLNHTSPRSFIIGWLFSTLQNNHSVASYYARMGMETFQEIDLFEKMEKYSLRRIKYDIYSFSTIWKLIKQVGNKYFG